MTRFSERGRQSLFGPLPILLGLLLTIALAWLVHDHNRASIRHELSSLADEAEGLIQERFTRYEYGLRGMRGPLITAGVEAITREQVERYIKSRDLGTEFPGALGFGFIRRVSSAQVPAFLATARADGAPDFAIKELAPNADERFVIQYIYPRDVNRRAEGLDIASERFRREAALSAARDGQPRLTAPITLVQADGKVRRGFLVLLAVYPPGLAFDQPAERQRAALGWSYAPLVVDDVLADLGRTQELVDLSLHAAQEDTPFFSTNSSVDRERPAGLAERTLYVMGQQWVLKVLPKPELERRLGLISPWLVLGVGLGLTALLFLGIRQWSAQPLADPDSYETGQAGDTSVLAFLRSSDVRKRWPLITFALASVVVLSTWLTLHAKLDDVRQRLRQSVSQAAAVFESSAADYQRDVRFLVDTPPVHGLVRAQATGRDSSDGSTAQQWRDRLGTIFEAYMLATPGVLQVRLIEAAPGWKESVRYERVGAAIRAVGPQDLQNKASESYIDATLRLGFHQVYASSINLNREHGVIERPHRPVWRFSKLIPGNDGRPFGLLIINVDASRLIRSALDRVQPGVDLYVTNQDGDFLQHPVPSKAYGFDLGTPIRWNDEFRPVRDWPGLGIPEVTSWTGEAGRIWTALATVAPIHPQADGGLSVYSAWDQGQLLGVLMLPLGLALGGALLFAFVGAGAHYNAWAEQQRQIVNRRLQVTEQRRKRENDVFKAMLDAVPEATVIANEAGVIEVVNARAEALFGHDRSRMLGKSVDMLIPARFSQHHHASFVEYIKHPKPHFKGRDYGLYALRADGTEVPIELSLNAVHTGTRLLVAASIRDISGEIATEDQLKQALDKAQQATTAKSAFLANTSHEIRTPLNAIIGLAHLLSEEALTDAQMSLVRKIQLSGRSLLGIVNDVLDLSKIEAEEMTVEALPVDLGELLEEVSSVFTPQAEAKGLNFRLDVAPDVPPWIETDGERVRQMLNNLLGNALKFTAKGEICLQAQLRWTPANRAQAPMLQLTVRDTGIGIPESVQHNLFMPFTQADASTTRKFGGTGLGLSIVRKLAELLKGEAGFESQEGVGSQFWVRLPVVIPSPDRVMQREGQNAALSILIAEDDPIDAQRIQKMVRALGWRAQVVESGSDLVDEFLKRREAGLSMPDVLLVDWQMPKMDGVQALRVLAHKVGDENLPAVLVISAHERAKIEALDIGHLVGQVLQKPLDSSELFNAVHDTVTRHTGDNRRVLQSTNSAAIKARWLVGVRVLVVDDSPTNLEVVTAILERQGASVVLAHDGQQALELLRDKHDTLDVVLMDVQMPGMDGLEATRRARQELSLANLPIIALTAGALVDERDKAMQAGMTDFLSKPVDPSQLINRIKLAVLAYRGKDIRLEPDPASLDQGLNPLWPDIPGLNRVAAQRMLMGDLNLFLSTLQNLLADNRSLEDPQLDNIDDQSAVALRESLAAQAHKLRSAAGTVGAERLHQLASQAEQALRASDPAAKPVLFELSKVLKSLRAASKEVLDEWRAAEALSLRADPDAADRPPLSPEVLTQIVSLLSNNDLAVLPLVDQHKQALSVALGGDLYHRFQSSMQALDFEKARGVLARLTS